MADGPMTPAYLREGVEFSVKLRGYDLEQVDDLLDRVADTIDELQRQVRHTTERAVRAEQLAADNAETDQALRRTLLVAQRTADDVIAEAEADAGRRRAEAEETARSIIVAAEAEAARLASEAQRTLRDDIASLESARDALQSDVDALDQHLSQERDRLRRLADAELLAAPAPAPTDVVVPPAPVVPVVPADAAPAIEPDVVPELPRIDPEPDEPQPLVVPAPEAEPEPEPQPEPVGTAAAAGDTGDDTAAVDIRSFFDTGDDDDTDREPVAAASHPEGVAVAHDDAFLAELRKASDDDAPLGPRDDAELFAGFGPIDGEHDLGLDRSRWGRRRRR